MDDILSAMLIRQYWTEAAMTEGHDPDDRPRRPRGGHRAWSLSGVLARLARTLAPAPAPALAVAPAGVRRIAELPR